MTGIPYGELLSMRADMNAQLGGTAVIHRAADTTDGQGGVTSAYSAAGTVACLLAPVTRRSRDEESIGDRVRASSEWYLSMPAGTDIRYRDRVLTGGGTFEVTAMREPRTTEIVRRVIMSQIDGA